MIHVAPYRRVKKSQQTLYTLATTTINNAVAGTAIAIPIRAQTADIRIDFAQVTTTAPASGTKLIVQVSNKTTGNDSWVDAFSVVTGTTAAESEAVTGTEAAGSTVIEVASTANLGPRSEWVFFKNGTLANSEWAYLISIVANTSITVLDGITYAQTGSTIYDQAVRYFAQLDVSGQRRIRLVVDNNNQATGPTVAVQAIADFREVSG